MGKKRSRKPSLTLIGDHAVSKKHSAISKQQKTKQRIWTPLDPKVLKEALLQQKEIADEDEAKANTSNDPFSRISGDDPNCLYYDTEDDDYSQEYLQTTGGGHEDVDDEEEEEEERILDIFMGKHDGSQPQQTLADVVLTRIRERDQHVSSEAQGLSKIDNSDIEKYKMVGKFLSNYTTGKLPKAFTDIRNMENWEDVLPLTEPNKWSPHAVFKATKIFASNLQRRQAERFYRRVLLPRVRDDIQKNKNRRLDIPKNMLLHPALTEALQAAIYKPDDFFKGILFSLCKSGTCTNQEAKIIGCVLRKISIPRSRPGAVIRYLAEMDFCATTSYFIKVLLDKKYCLQYPVIHGLVAHFTRHLDDTRKMPVIWHQALLSFVQWYKNALTKEDKDKLLRLVEVQSHHQITPEIKRELNNSCDGVEEHPISTIYTAPSIIEDRFDIPDVPMEED